jgi:hypothetical protein
VDNLNFQLAFKDLKKAKADSEDVSGASRSRNNFFSGERRKELSRLRPQRVHKSFARSPKCYPQAAVDNAAGDKLVTIA